MITIITSTQKLREVRYQLWKKFPQKKIGFIPTMGNLHNGHLSLIKASLEKCDKHFVSIFVNPKQFGPNEDFARYPRTLEADIEKIKAMAGKKHIYIFAPEDTNQIYPDKFETTVSLPRFNQILCGVFRPGHFDGVATVVYRLFNLVRPHYAFFGEKDYQQLIVIKNMTRDMLLPVKVIGLPIVRDIDGLALSSRNQYLSPEQREHALFLPRTLTQIREKILSEGVEIAHQLCQSIVKKDANWDYLEIREQSSLEIADHKSRKIIILAVYRQGATRLLDNLMLDLPHQKQI